MGMQLIETIEVGSGGAASIEFTSIPQDGVDILLLMSLRADADSPSAFIQLNSSTSNYNRIHLQGLDGAVQTGTSTYRIYVPGGRAKSTSTANTFSNAQMYVSNYATTATKTISVDGANENNGSVQAMGIVANSWAGGAAVTSILIESGTVEFSTASLYKITAD